MTRILSPASALDPQALAAHLKQAAAGHAALMDHLADQVRRRVALRRASQSNLGGPEADALVSRMRQPATAKRQDKPIALFLLAGACEDAALPIARAIAEIVHGGAAHVHRFDLRQCKGTQGYAWMFGGENFAYPMPGALHAALHARADAVVLVEHLEAGDRGITCGLLRSWYDGVVTNWAGSKATTTKATFILTTGHQRREISEHVVGKDHASDELQETVKYLLSFGEKAIEPEVLSRIDHIFAFPEA